MIRHLTRISIAAAATAAVSLAPAAVAQASQHCKPHGSSGVVADNYARVYARAGNVYVCVKSSGKTTKLRGGNPAYRSRSGASGLAGARSSPAAAPRTPP